MKSLRLQDWTTIRILNTISSVTQSEDCWLDVEPYQDLVIWTDVKSVTGSPGTLTLTYETAPCKDDSFFSPIFTGFSPAAAALPRIDKRLMTDAATLVPPAKWLRWKLGLSGATGAWDVTFRVWIAANSANLGK